MALDMSPEQKETGKGNFNRVVGKLAEADQEAQNQSEQGVTRRRFMQGLIAAGATVPVSAAAYFGYRNHGFPRDFRPVRAGIIGCGDEGGVLVGYHNPSFVKFVAYSDVRKSNQTRIFVGQPNSPRLGFNHHYGNDCKQWITLHEDYRRMLADPEIEMIVIALPLHLHYRVTMDALDAGKHVLCEKLMAWNIRQCKRMIQKAADKKLLLSIGHQRHYSMLYAHANEVVTSGVLGDVRHIRALWHRNNVRPNTNAETSRDRPLLDSWWPLIPPEDRAHLREQVDGVTRFNKLQLDRDYKDIEELVRWRLYHRTGGGLMAELGSHQLDACSIFLGGKYPTTPEERTVYERRKRPLSVMASGGTHFYTDNREVEDHVYCIYEFRGERYVERNASSRRNDVVTVTYSSINTNGFEPYGECVMGSKGTLVVSGEEEAMLWGMAAPNSTTPARSTDVSVSAGGVAPLDTGASSGPAERRAQTAGSNSVGAGPVSKGYREEMEHLAYCIRMREQVPESQWDEFKPRCDGKAAMADAIIALTANQSMKKRERIEFKDSWFDPASDEVPDGDMVEANAR